MEIKDVLSTLGIDAEVKDASQFKELFEQKFVAIDELKERKELIEPYVSKAIGKRLGSLETEVKRIAKESAIDIESDEFKGKPIEELTKTVFKKFAESNLSVVKNLQEKLSANSGDAVAKIQKEAEQWKTKYSEVESLLNDTKNQFTKLQEDKENEIKSFKIEVKKKNVWDSIGLKKDITPVEKTGFEALLNSKYSLDLEEDTIVVKTKDGKRIKNDKVVGQFKTFEEILKEEAEANGLISKNPHAGKPAFVPANPTTNTTVVEAKNRIPLHPRLQRMMNK